MSEYMRECSFCKEKIKMSDQKGKWLPFDQDGSTHECKKNGKNKKEFTLEAVQNKLESIGIIINVERLMKMQ
jgi:hypothetical protein